MSEYFYCAKHQNHYVGECRGCKIVSDNPCAIITRAKLEAAVDKMSRLVGVEADPKHLTDFLAKELGI